MTTQPAPPHNVEAEQAVLGAFLIDPETIKHVNGLQAEHFYLRKHQLIYVAQRDLISRGEPVDLITLGQELGNNLALVGGAVYLFQLINATPSAINVASYASIVTETWKRREVLRLLSEVAKATRGYTFDSSIYSDINSIQAQIAALTAPTSAQAEFQSFAEIAPTLEPITWIWPGWVPQGMITLLGAAPGAGKSLVALDMARRIIHGMNWPDGALNARSGNVIYVDAEFVPQLLKSRCESWQLDMSRLFLMLPDANDAVDFSSDKYKDRLRAMIERLKPELVIVDSLSSITTRGENNIEDIRGILAFLNEIATSYHVGLVLIHHLRKRGQLAFDLDEITIDDFRGSGHIIAMARSVLGLCTIRTGPEPDKNGPRKLQIVKTNLGAYPKSLGCDFKPLHPDGVMLDWNTSAPKAYHSPSQADLCRAWLLDLLSSEPLSPKEVVDLARDEGYSRATVFRVRQDLGIQIRDTEGRRSPNNRWELGSSQTCQN